MDMNLLKGMRGFFALVAVIGTMAAVLPASADIIILNVDREIQVKGVASAGAENDSFDVVQTGPASGLFNAFLDDSASAGSAVGTAAPEGPAAWVDASASQSSSIGAADFLAIGSVSAVAGTIPDPNFIYSANSWDHSEFEVIFQLTTPYMMDFSGFHDYSESGAANPSGGIRLQGPGGFDLFFGNQTFDVHQLLLPGDYTLMGRAGVDCSAPSGQGGGQSTIMEEYGLSLCLAGAEVPEPSTIVLLGLGAVTLLYRKVKGLA